MGGRSLNEKRILGGVKVNKAVVLHSGDLLLDWKGLKEILSKCR